jgi:hypothetical protein
MKRGVVLALVVVVNTGACTTADIEHVGPQRPAKPLGCAVEIFSSSNPPYEFIDIASVKARCRRSSPNRYCADEVRAKACALGGDTVYGFARGATRDYTMVSATVAYRRGTPVQPQQKEPADDDTGASSGESSGPVQPLPMEQ